MRTTGLIPSSARWSRTPVSTGLWILIQVKILIGTLRYYEDYPKGFGPLMT